MIRIALKGLAGRKFRAALTAFSIVLGVAMVSGTYILTDTIDKAFDTLFSRTYEGTDAVITGKAADISFQGDTPDAPPVDESLLAEVRQLPTVEEASGVITEETAAKILEPDGDVVDTQGSPSFGFGIHPRFERFNPLNLLEGRYARAPNEIVIDAGTADDQGFEVGETVRVSTLKPARPFRLVGIAQYGGVDTIGSATFAVFTIPTAQELFDREGKLDAIQIAAREGVTPEELVAQVRTLLPPTAQVQTGVEQAEEESEEIAEFTTIIRYFLLSFGGIALFVGAFVIFNTLSITVAQRVREFATLRTIGASRRQILGSVILEALVIGAIASLIGLALGYLLAKGLSALLAALELELPSTALVFAPRTVLVSLIVGIAVTLLAGLAPALRATRVPPVAAVREGAALPPSRLSRFTPVFAALAVLAAVLLLGYGMFVDDLGTAERLLSLAVGCLALFVGVALLSSRLVRPLAHALGWPATRIGGAAGALARGNAQRNPGRTAATAAALMIGIALVSFIAVLAEGLNVSNSDAIKRQIVADYVVTSTSGFEPFVAGAGDAVARAPVAELATDVRSEVAEIQGSGQYLTGIEPGEITEGYRFDWQEGSDAVLARLGNDGAIVDDGFADDKELELGDQVRVVVPSGERADFVVRAIYEPPPFYPLLGTVSISKARFDQLFERPRNQFTFVNVTGEPNEAAKRALERAAASFPDAKVQTREEWIQMQEDDLNQFLGLLYVLLALSVVVSLFGMVNTLVLSVFERTREVGMLRAVGMTRRQVRRMVRHESVITALIGAALGLPLGIFLAALVTRALAQFELEFAIPFGSLVIFAIVAVIAGVLAAILPARRAARLNVLRALQYE